MQVNMQRTPSVGNCNIAPRKGVYSVFFSNPQAYKINMHKRIPHIITSIQNKISVAQGDSLDTMAQHDLIKSSNI